MAYNLGKAMNNSRVPFQIAYRKGRGTGDAVVMGGADFLFFLVSDSVTVKPFGNNLE